MRRDLLNPHFPKGSLEAPSKIVFVDIIPRLNCRSKGKHRAQLFVDVCSRVLPSGKHTKNYGKSP
jgi:hypothetical protein